MEIGFFLLAAAFVILEGIAVYLRIDKHQIERENSRAAHRAFLANTIHQERENVILHSVPLSDAIDRYQTRTAVDAMKDEDNLEFLKRTKK